jgi:2-amino-4-hydroxy-6-hydroxymethyldihydropteridine diphosphokinase
MAYIAIGANLGNVSAAVLSAMSAIDALPQTKVVGRSSLYDSAPVDAGGPDYVNAVIAVQTRLTAPALLGELQMLEGRAGRERNGHNAPRTLDLDLLLFGDGSLDSARLTVPHPRMWQRAFVLVPLSEVAPHRVSTALLDSVAGQSISRHKPR